MSFSRFFPVVIAWYIVFSKKTNENLLNLGSIISLDFYEPLKQSKITKSHKIKIKHQKTYQETILKPAVDFHNATYI